MVAAEVEIFEMLPRFKAVKALRHLGNFITALTFSPFYYSHLHQYWQQFKRFDIFPGS